MATAEEVIEEIKAQLPGKLASDIEASVPEGLTKTQLRKIYERVYEEFDNARAEAGESVGIISAESIGEPSTQMTLDTKHAGGVAELNVTTGLPRIIEILDGRKAISTPSMDIYLLPEHNNEKDVRKFAFQIKETYLEEVADEFTINLEQFSVEVSIRPKRLADLEMDGDALVKKLNKSMKKLKAELLDQTTVTFSFRGKEDNFNELYRVKDKLRKASISGIKGVSQVLPVKRGEEFVIVTAGSNVKEVMKKEFVDTERTTTNDIFEIYEYFGIEAARQAVITEVYKVMETQGLNIDIRHVMLVADTMCNGMAPQGITRYGVIRQKASVLARASFETALNHIINAAIIGERDPMNSIVENVMVNQHIPAGTGLPKLTTNFEK